MHDTSSKLDITKFVVAYDDSTQQRIYGNVVGLDFRTLSHQNKIVLLIDAPISDVQYVERLEEQINRLEDQLRSAKRDADDFEDRLKLSEAAERRQEIQIKSLTDEVSELWQLTNQLRKSLKSKE